MPAFYGAVDLVKNELRNAVVQNLGSAPASPLKGQVYFDTSTNILYFWDGTAWQSTKGTAITYSGTVTTQAIGDTGTAGVAATTSRGDHGHGMPAFGTVVAQTGYGGASANGSAASIARSDHLHGTVSLTATAPSTQAIGDAAAVGAGTDPARNDHKHGMPAFGGAVTAETTFGQASGVGAAATLPRSDHTHGSPTHLAADHSSISLSAFAVPTADLNIGSHKLINVTDPTNPQDASTKLYVDNAIAGLSWKAPARAASTANLALTGTQTVDGVALIAGDRILVKNQTTPSANGIYVVAAGAWARSTDADAANELLNAAVYIEEGTTQADTAWTGTANAPITVGSTNLPFVQFSGAGTYTAGNGLTLTGNVFAVGAGSGILSNPGAVAVDTTVVALKTDITGMTKKYAVGLTGTASPETVTHNLNTRDVQVTVLNGASPYGAVEVDWQAATVNTVTINYNPQLGAGYRCVVVG
jgi:hypothetical protein